LWPVWRACTAPTTERHTDPSAIANARSRRVAHAIGLHNETVSNIVQADLDN